VLGTPGALETFLSFEEDRHFVRTRFQTSRLFEFDDGGYHPLQMYPLVALYIFICVSWSVLEAVIFRCLAYESVSSGKKEQSRSVSDEVDWDLPRTL